jgi:hypothetical protein
MNQLPTANSSVSREHPYTSFETLSDRYSQLNELSEMDDDQKIEVFAQVLEMMNNDLNRERD